MRRCCDLAILCVAFLALVCIPALADTHDNFSNEKLTGGSGSAVSGSFTFTGNASGGTFSNLSLSFTNGTFGGVNALDQSGGQATCLLGLCAFSWQVKVGNVWVSDTIILNVNTGQYWDSGTIGNWQNQWYFDPLPAPEGGTTLSYLVLSGIVMVAGILISGKRRAMRPARSS